MFCCFGTFGLEMLAVLCKEVPVNLEAARSHSCHYSLACLCVQKEMCSLSKDFGSPNQHLPPSLGLGAGPSECAASRPPALPEERTALGSAPLSARSQSSCRWALRAQAAGAGQ